MKQLRTAREEAYKEAFHMMQEPTEQVKHQVSCGLQKNVNLTCLC